MILNFNYLQSIIISLLLINGLFNISFIASNYISKFIKTNEKFFSTIITFFLVVNTLAIVTFNISLFFKLNYDLIKYIAISIIILGLYKPYYLKYFFRKIFENKKLDKIIIYLILFFYFLLSILPITDPDTLDYHFTVPFYKLNFNMENFPHYWLTSQLAGAGETLFSYAITLGAIHFSQILQYFSLLLLILFILNFKNKKISFSEEKKFYVCVSILLIPTLIFLVTTSKPQIFSIVSNFFALILTLFYLPYLKNKKNKIAYFFIFFLLISSIQFKFSFLLSASLISFLTIYQQIKKNFDYKIILIPFLLFLIILLPREIVEYKQLNSDIIFNFFNPVTDEYSAVDFNASLKHGTGNNRLFPIWMFIPTKIIYLTYSLGLTVFYFVFNYELKKSIIIKGSLISFLFILLALIFAQPVGRFFLEPFIWLLFFSIFYFKKKKHFLLKIFEKLLKFSSICFVFVIGYYSLYFINGSFGKNAINQLMTQHADGYLLYQWANKEIPDNKVILSTHRSLSFYKHKAITAEFRLYSTSKSQDGFNYYVEKIIKEQPKYILYTSHELNTQTDVLRNCRGKLFKYKKNVGHTAGRNPFFKKFYYDGYIFHIDIEKLKNCKI